MQRPSQMVFLLYTPLELSTWIFVKYHPTKTSRNRKGAVFRKRKGFYFHKESRSSIDIGDAVSPKFEKTCSRARVLVLKVCLEHGVWLVPVTRYRIETARIPWKAMSLHGLSSGCDYGREVMQRRAVAPDRQVVSLRYIGAESLYTRICRARTTVKDNFVSFKPSVAAPRPPPFSLLLDGSRTKRFQLARPPLHPGKRMGHPPLKGIVSRDDERTSKRRMFTLCCSKNLYFASLCA